MVKRWVNIIILSVVILCSTSFYKFSFLGSFQSAFELMGTLIIFVLLLFHLIYSHQKSIKKNFTLAVILIVISMITSMITAYITREQRIIHTMLAQRALYYYFLYFLLHQLKFDSKDLEKLIIFFAVLYIGLQLLQTVLYPIQIFDANLSTDRGTLRIYIPGAHYIAIGFFMYLQKFLRSNKFYYTLLLLPIFWVYVMRGGRQPLAILILVTVLFVIIDRKVKSRVFMILLGSLGAFSAFLIFRDIFMALFIKSQQDIALGEEYIRIKCARYYITDFFKSQIAYITGNGMYYPHSKYGKLIALNAIKYHYHLGDIGLIGNYAIYGLFFVLGVILISIKSLIIKIESEHVYLKYFVFAVILSIILGGGFANADFICLCVMVLYLIDVSNQSYVQNNHEKKNSLVT